MNDRNASRRPRPEWLAVQAFAVTIAVGTVLLSLPWASSSGHWNDPVTALFTATSATCVTGLIVVDTGSHFSLFGQGVILTLIQLGGLGIMTLGTFLLLLVGRRLTMKDEFVLMDSLGHERLRGLKPLLAYAVLFTLLIEITGTALLASRLTARHGFALHRAIYHSAFHAVSSFCNAGFSLYADNLQGLREDRAVVLTVTALIVLGGLGFLVLFNLSSIRFWRRDRLRRGRLSLHSKIVLAATAFFLAFGFAAFLSLEWRHGLAGLGWPDKLTCSFLQCATPRTAGFNVVETARLRPLTALVTLLFMFVGGSPASTAGGIKTTTVLVLVFSVRAMIRGREETEVFGRTIPMKVVREALTIFVLSAAVITLFFGVLLTVERGSASGANASCAALLFETVSAFCTVGLSTGITPHLCAAGKLALVCCMFIGRLGPLTIALIVGGRELRQKVRFPEEEIVVG